ncbi:MAG TPA: hypothetical protein VFR81_01625 [Longimicrobium sp.]|nr:hypothetical protein [Longimicrobium sp.]
MGSRNAVTPVAVLREALGAEVEETSLRHASRLVGMSPAVLQKFLDGDHPYSDARRMLERWYVLHGPGRLEPGLRGDSAMTILRVLVQDLSPARHRPTMELLVASMEEAYRSARLPAPGWLDDLASELHRESRA